MGRLSQPDYIQGQVKSLTPICFQRKRRELIFVFEFGDEVAEVSGFFKL